MNAVVRRILMFYECALVHNNFQICWEAVHQRECSGVDWQEWVTCLMRG